MKKSVIIFIFMILLLTLTACSRVANVKLGSSKSPQQELLDSSAVAVNIRSVPTINTMH